MSDNKGTKIFRTHEDDSVSDADIARANELVPGLGKLLKAGADHGEAFIDACQPEVKIAILYAFAPSMNERGLTSHLLFPKGMKGKDKQKQLQQLLMMMHASMSELVNIAGDDDNELFKDRVLQ